ncbi:hypothetical protein C8F04DRAFT_1104347, partial [Mycena alexandri]
MSMTRTTKRGARAVRGSARGWRAGIRCVAAAAAQEGAMAKLEVAAEEVEQHPAPQTAGACSRRARSCASTRSTPPCIPRRSMAPPLPPPLLRESQTTAAAAATASTPRPNASASPRSSGPPPPSPSPSSARTSWTRRGSTSSSSARRPWSSSRTRRARARRVGARLFFFFILIPLSFSFFTNPPLFFFFSHSPTLKNIFPTWTRVAPPLYAGRGCMHVKLLLLFYKDALSGPGANANTGGGRGWLRVVVGSANLVRADWRDVENYVFVQDIPPAAPNSKQPTTRLRTREKPGESFPAMLARTLRALGVEEALGIMGKQGHDALPLPTLLPPSPKDKSPLETNWDWRQVRAALVPSIAGRSMGWAGDKAVVWNAQPRLLRAVLALGCALDEGVAIGVSDPNPEAKR